MQTRHIVRLTVTGTPVSRQVTQRFTRSHAASSSCLRPRQPEVPRLQLRTASAPVHPRLSSAIPALQQRHSSPPASQQQSAPGESDFSISLDQMRTLAGNKGTNLFENSEFNSLFQLTESLRVSVEFGLVNDASDLNARKAAFGANKLPDKAEASLQATDQTCSVLCDYLVESMHNIWQFAYCSCYLGRTLDICCRPACWISSRVLWMISQ